MTRLKIAAVLGAFSLIFLSALPCFSNEKQGEAGAPGPETITEIEMEQAAKAYAKIMEMQQDLQQSIQQAGDDRQKIQALQENANRKMSKAVEDEGLDVQRYTKIIQNVQMDNTSRKRFMEKLKQIE